MVRRSESVTGWPRKALQAGVSRSSGTATAPLNFTPSKVSRTVLSGAGGGGGAILRFSGDEAGGGAAGSAWVGSLCDSGASSAEAALVQTSAAASSSDAIPATPPLGRAPRPSPALLAPRYRNAPP